MTENQANKASAMAGLGKDALNNRIKELKGSLTTTVISSVSSANVALMASNFMINGFAAMVKAVANGFTSIFSSYFIPSVRISSKDEAFQWVLMWLSKSEYGQNSALQLQILPSQLLNTSTMTHFSGSAAEKEKHKRAVNYVPASGVHYIRHKGKFFRFEYSLDDSEGSEARPTVSHGHVGGSIVISTIGTSTKALKEFVQSVQENFIKMQLGKTLVYVPDNWCDFWEAKVSRQKRPSKSVILAGNLFEELQHDCAEFLKQEKFYEDRGCPFRRGYLLYGPPGTGKTSTVLALAGVLDLNICVLNVTNKNLTDDKLLGLLLNAPPNSIILLEDIDHALNSAFTAASSKKKSKQKAAQNAASTTIEKTPADAKDSRENSDIESFEIESEEYYDGSGEGVSYSGLLNSIDGVVAQEGRVLFMTTNHLDRLPASLTRPGRVDVIKKIDYATPEQVERLFLKFYPQAFKEAGQFTEAIARLRTGETPEATESLKKKYIITPAQLQGFFLRFKEKPAAAVKHVEELFGDSESRHDTVLYLPSPQ